MELNDRQEKWGERWCSECDKMTIAYEEKNKYTEVIIRKPTEEEIKKIDEVLAKKKKKTPRYFNPKRKVKVHK